MPQLQFFKFKTLLMTLSVVIASLVSLNLVLADEGQPTTEAKKVLTIGSKAPVLDIEHWVSDGEGKFKKVTAFDMDKVYVVEFWATWCGPCIASMPHIVEMQKNYADKGVQVVSVSNEDIETVQKFLERKIPSSDYEQTYGNLTKTYCLTTDPDGSTSKDYMRASGQNGIPCAFIVGKTGLIEWIGHPMSMDKTLASVVDNKWDREAFAIAFKQEQEFDVAVVEIGTLARAKKFDEAIELLSKINSSDNIQLESQKSQMLISLLISAKRHDEALTLINKLLAENPKDSTRLVTFKIRAMLSMEGKESETLALVKSLCEDEEQPSMLKINLISQLSTSIINKTITKTETIEETKKIADALLAKIPGESALGLLISLSALAEHTEDKDKAIAYLEKAIKVNTNPRVVPILKQRLNLLIEPSAQKEKQEKEESDK